MKIREHKTDDVGIFQSKKGFRRVSASLLALSLVALIIASLQLFIGLDFTMLLLIPAVFWVIIAVSNLVIASRLNSRNFEEGDVRKVIVLGNKDPYTKFIKFIGPDDEPSGRDDNTPR